MFKRKCRALSDILTVFIVISVLQQCANASRDGNKNSRLKRSPQSIDLSNYEIIYAGDFNTQRGTKANTQLSQQETQLIISLISNLNTSIKTPDNKWTLEAGRSFDLAQESQNNQVTPAPETTTQRQEFDYYRQDYYPPPPHYPPPPPPPPPPYGHYPPPPGHYPPPPEHCPPPPGHHGPPPDGRPPPKHCPPPPPYHYPPPPPPPPPHHYPPPPPPPPHHYPPPEHHYPPHPGHHPPPPHHHGPPPDHHPRPPPHHYERPKDNDIHGGSQKVTSSESKDPYDIERHGQPIKRDDSPDYGGRWPPDHRGRGPPPNGGPPDWHQRRSYHEGRGPPPGRGPPDWNRPPHDYGGRGPPDWRGPPPDRRPPGHGPPPDRDRPASDNSDRADHNYSNNPTTQKSTTEEEFLLDVRYSNDGAKSAAIMGYFKGQVMAVTPAT